MDIFINLYDNSNIDCNKRNKNKLNYLYNNVIINKFDTSDINRSFYY